ncbi:MAG TPA: HPP family protein [Candidatus Sulfotelmatobacter sp.]|nr:HPP family protein [Candidatus Sulfotelmatobacter sp.]
MPLSAKTYNVIVGHLVGLGAGFLSLWPLGAWNAPKVAMAGFVSSPRLWAAVVAVVITTAVTLALKASQPASLATTLLVALGSMQTRRDAIVIVIGVLLLAALGYPLRRISQQVPT